MSKYFRTFVLRGFEITLKSLNEIINECRQDNLKCEKPEMCFHLKSNQLQCFSVAKLLRFGQMGKCRRKENKRKHDYHSGDRCLSPTKMHPLFTKFTSIVIVLASLCRDDDKITTTIFRDVQLICDRQWEEIARVSKRERLQVAWNRTKIPRWSGKSQ